MYASLIRPLLFRLDPEQAHNLTIQTLAHAYCLMPRVNPHTKPTALMGWASVLLKSARLRRVRKKAIRSRACFARPSIAPS